MGEGRRGMKLLVAPPWPHRGGPWPFLDSAESRSALSPSIGSRHVSAFSILNGAWISARHPQRAGSSLAPENSLLQITALRPFHSSPSGESWGPRAGGTGGSGWPALEADRGSRERGVGWEPGGSEAVNEGPAGWARGRRDGRPLTPGQGAHPPTTSPPLSAVSLCPRKWLSGQCPGPGDMEQSSDLGPSPAAPTWPPSAPPGPLSCGVHPAPHLVGVILFHPRLAVVLAGKDGEQSVSIPTPSTAGPGCGGPRRLAPGER